MHTYHSTVGYTQYLCDYHIHMHMDVLGAMELYMYMYMYMYMVRETNLSRGLPSDYAYNAGHCGQGN